MMKSKKLRNLKAKKSGKRGLHLLIPYQCNGHHLLKMKKLTVDFLWIIFTIISQKTFLNEWQQWQSMHFKREKPLLKQTEFSTLSGQIKCWSLLEGTSKFWNTVLRSQTFFRREIMHWWTDGTFQRLLAFKQHVPSKPTHHGIKLFLLCGESELVYMTSFTKEVPPTFLKTLEKNLDWVVEQLSTCQTF